MISPNPTTRTCEMFGATAARCGAPAKLRDDDTWLCLDCAAFMLGQGSLSSEATQTLLGLLKAAGQEAVERAGKATEEPWTVDGAGDVLAPGKPDDRDSRLLFEADPSERFNPANSDFAAAARADVPLLGAAVLALVAEVERCRANVLGLAEEQLTLLGERDELKAEVERLQSERPKFTELLEASQAFTKVLREVLGGHHIETRWRKSVRAFDEEK